MLKSYDKAKFRKTEDWLNFRQEFRENNLDALTNEPLKSKYTLHHNDLNPDNYKVLKAEKFFGFNTSFEHRIVHYLYSRFIKDPQILMRLEKIIKYMVEINKWKDIKDYR